MDIGKVFHFLTYTMVWHDKIQSYYIAALQHVCAAKESRTVHNIEAMVLLVLYHLRSASNHGIWYMIGLAMRTCIDLGLHRRRRDEGEGDKNNNTRDYHHHHQQGRRGRGRIELEMRRRLFWTIYVLERVIAISLGRPFSIPDRQIDVDLPDEFFNTDVQPEGDDGNGNGGRARSPSDILYPLPPENDSSSSTARRPAHRSDSNSGSRNAKQKEKKKKWEPATLFVLLIEVRRLESRTQYSIYRADKPLSSLMSKVEPIYQALEKWKQTTIDKLGGQPKNFHYAMLLYHKVRLCVCWTNYSSLFCLCEKDDRRFPVSSVNYICHRPPSFLLPADFHHDTD